MSERPTINYEEDPVSAISIGEKKVSDVIQDARDERAYELRLQRKERDTAHQESERYTSESQKIGNRFMGIFRKPEDPRHPNFLRSLAEKYGNDADAFQSQAIKKRDSFQGELNQKLAVLLREHIIDNLAYNGDGLGKNNTLESISVNDVYKLLCSDFEGLNVETFSKVRKIADATWYEVAEHLRMIEALQEELPADHERKIFTGEKFMRSIFEAEVKNGFSLTNDKPEYIIRMLQGIPGGYTDPNIKVVLGELANSMDEHKLTAVPVHLIGMLHSENPDHISAILLHALDEYLEGKSQEITDAPQSMLSDAGALVNMISGIAYPEIRIVVNKRIAEYIGDHFGVPNPLAVVDTWQQNDPTKFLDFKENVNMLRRLSGEYPEGPRLLVSFYGIHMFQRYPFELLASQIENHDNDSPYGIAVQAYHDNNGIFNWKYVDIFDGLMNDIKGKDVLRVIETGNVVSLLKTFSSLRKKFSQKIRFGIMAGHGSRWTIDLGNPTEHGEVRKDKGKHTAFEINGVRGSTSLDGGIKDMFDADATIAFASCSTGAEDGIAQIFSEKLGLHVIAPKVDVSFTSAHVVYVDGKPKLNMEYSKT